MLEIVLVFASPARFLAVLATICAVWLAWSFLAAVTP